jgi:hypothetical protein
MTCPEELKTSKFENASVIKEKNGGCSKNQG